MDASFTGNGFLIIAGISKDHKINIGGFQIARILLKIVDARYFEQLITKWGKVISGNAHQTAQNRSHHR